MDKQKTIVFQAEIKVLTGPISNGVWKDTVLTLFADSSVEYEVDKVKEVARIGPTITTTRSKKANYAEVFVINTTAETDYGSGPTFSAADAKSADEWIHKITRTRELAAVKGLHPHPLTRATTNEEDQGLAMDEEGQGGIKPTSVHIPKRFKCNHCDRKFYDGSTCEFCDNYFVCPECEAFLKTLQGTMIKSPTHEHPLKYFSRANDPLFFGSEYNGQYNCDQCKSDQSGEVYHCLDCDFYDECPKCAKAGIPTTVTIGSAARLLGNFVGNFLQDGEASKKDSVQPTNRTLSSPTHLELKHLSPAMEVTNNSNTLTLKSGFKLPKGMSLISNQPWDLLDIEVMPVPSAYMEVTFDSFAPNHFVGVGIGNQIWVQNQMLGLQQNSYGYFNDGTIAHNAVTKEDKYFAGFQAGDTIGVGILYDSFNSRRLFFTKNGNMVGHFPAVIHKGMDCFPGVSFTNTSQVKFTVNMTGPFKFDTNFIPDNRNNKINHIRTVPAEIVAGILSSVLTKPRVALEMRLVNKTFSQLACDNQIWKPMFLTAWPLQHSKLKLKSWYTLYKRRSEANGKPTKPGASKSFIENCDFEFQCPMLWEAMKEGKNPTERFCDKCQKTVYSVSDNATLSTYAEIGRCVSFVPKKIAPPRPMPPQHFRLGGAPRPPPRSIPPPPKK